MPRPHVRRFLPPLLLALVTVTGGCSSRPAAPAALSGTSASVEELAAAVLTRVASRDAAGLRALALSEAEFRDHVWPHLPVSRPERNVPFDYVWGQQRQRSDGQLQQTLARHGGRAYTLVAVRFDGETSEYGPVTVHRDTVLTVRTPEGDETPVRLFGAVLEEAGRFKIYSFVVD